ncbi:MAG: DUF4293 domain-containing protein [Flavobacteriaceae bacterium]|nr:DUF4293 domain-containing protein [Flavobacteriaceae bacterium]
MIQRIQSLYLLIVAILNSQVFLFPFLIFFKGEESKIIEMGALETNTGEYIFPLAILFGIIIFLSVLSIFLFKNRMLQIRLTIINILLLLGSMGLTAYLGWTLFQSLTNYEIQYNFTCIFPPISIIFSYLAIRAISKDEALVRSANRIR